MQIYYFYCYSQENRNKIILIVLLNAQLTYNSSEFPLTRSVFQLIMLLIATFFGKTQGKVIEIECHSHGIAVAQLNPALVCLRRVTDAGQHEHFVSKEIAPTLTQVVNGIEPTPGETVSYPQIEFLPPALPSRLVLAVYALIVIIGQTLADDISHQRVSPWRLDAKTKGMPPAGDAVYKALHDNY